MEIYPYLIIGGGPAGVAAAWALAEGGQEFCLIEASDRLGGRVQSLRTPQATLELGPNTLSPRNVETVGFLRGLELWGDRLLPAAVAKRRFIVRHSQVVELPSSPLSLLSTRALSLRGKLRLAREFFFVAPSPGDAESVADFFRRHFGSEVANYVVDPFISGIFAGDPEALVAAEAFPRMVAAERASGSLIRHLVKTRRPDAAIPPMVGFRGGLSSIFDRAATVLGAGRLRLGETIRALKRGPQGTFAVESDKGNYAASQLFIAAPADAAAKLLAPLSARLGAALEAIDYAPVVVLHLSIAKTEAYPFQGFGLLAPGCERRKILGVLWSSSIFPDLFPDSDHHTLTVYCGGARDREALYRSDDVLQGEVSAELSSLFGLRATPNCLRITRYERAIPQYTAAYRAAKTEIADELRQFPGLHLIGNYLGGISLSDTIASAIATACRVFRHD